METFKYVKGYGEKYAVSNLGRVISYARYNKGKELKVYYKKNGYCEVVLFDNSNSKNANHILLHRLVAENFVDNPDGKEFVNHKDGNKHNNKACNLEWCTRSENQKHAYKTGLQRPNVHGEKAVVVTEIITGEKFVYKSIKEACRRLGLHQWCVQSVLRGKITQTKGYYIEHYKAENQMDAERKGV